MSLSTLKEDFSRPKRKMDEKIANDLKPGHLFVFGLGYSTTRLSKRLLALGWKVSGTNRSQQKVIEAESIGISSMVFDEGTPLREPEKIFSDVTHIIASIPPSDKGEIPLMLHSNELRKAPCLTWMSYLSTPAVYGDRSGGIASETDKPTPTSKRGQRRLAAESAWIKTYEDLEVSVQIMRIAGIYGPGRSAIDQVILGKARIIEKAGQVFNRIHVDDIGTSIIASMVRPKDKGVYNLADGNPCASGDVTRYACELLQVKPPEPISFEDAELSEMARSFYSECKVLTISRLKNELMVDLRYPSYKEGLRQIFENKS